MAVAFCKINQQFGLDILHESFIKRSHVTRSYPGVLFLNASKRSLFFCCSTENLFSRTSKVKKQSQRGKIFCKSTTHYNDGTYEEGKEEDIPKVTLIWRAIKLPMYSVALVPLSVGGAAAYLQTGMFSARRYFVLLASSILIITWLNLSNDVYDFDTGADKNKKESVVNLVGSRSGTSIAAYVSLALGFMGLTWTSLGTSSMQAILLLACAITCGYVYQCPPFRLSYQGLGEPLCFSAFGPFATIAFYLLLGSTSEMNNLPLTSTVLSVSLLVGFTTSLILFCSHFHQIEGDRAVGKLSPLVRLGTERGSYVVKAAIMTLYSLLLAFGLCRALPFPCILLCALTIPLGKLVVRFVEENHKDKGKIFMAKYYCVSLHAFFGAALAAGLVAARMLTGRPVPNLMFSCKLS